MHTQLSILLHYCHANKSRLIMNIRTMLSMLKVINEVMKVLNDIEVHSYVRILSLYIQYA